MHASKYPCDPIRDDTNPDDPWAANPSIEQVFRNFIVYKNKENGVLAEDTGNLFFVNFTIAESWRAGIEFYLSNFTRETPSLNDSAIIGVTAGNAHSDNTNYSNMTAMWTGRAGPVSFKDVSVHNYPAGSWVMKTCSHCDDPKKFTSIGNDIYVEGLTFTNISGNWLQMTGAGLKREVIYDMDGSFSTSFDGQTRPNGTITHYWPSTATTPSC